MGTARSRKGAEMATGGVDALVIFGATGDLAKLETFPALVGLVQRGVLDVPVVGVAKSGWGLEQFRDYATASLNLNHMDPGRPAAGLSTDRLQARRGPERPGPGAGPRPGGAAGRAWPGVVAGRQVAGDLGAAAADRRGHRPRPVRRLPRRGRRRPEVDDGDL